MIPVQIIILPVGPNRAAKVAGVCAYLERLSVDNPWHIEVKPHKKTRSKQQNDYLWVIYNIILQSGQLEGWEKQDLHEYFLGEHFGWETLEGMGRRRMRPLKRSSKLSTTEFSDYVDFIQRKAAEMGIYIPDANEEFQ